MATVASLNRAKYAGLDFNTHGDDLRSRLQVQFAADFNDFAISSLGIMLLDLTAFGLDTLSFYLDRRATDTFLETARTRKSISRLARQLGYAPGGAVSSGVDLDVSIDQVGGFAFSAPIPQGFQFNGPNNLIFETAQEVTFPPAAGPGDVLSIPCFEGQTFNETFVSDGTANQVFELKRLPEDTFLVQGTVTCSVDGAPFTWVPLLEFGTTDQFEVGFSDVPPTIRFGDGIAGNIPVTGASVEVTYVAGRGKAGQVADGTITEPTNNLVVAFTTIPLLVNNPEPSVGGDDLESLSSIKTFAPEVFKTRKVAVTGEDYSALGGSYADPLFGRVAVAKAISARSADADVTLQNLLKDITDAIASFDTDLAVQTSAIAASVATATTARALATISVDTDVIAAFTDVEAELTTIQTQARSIKNSAGEISVDAVDIQGFVTLGKADILAIPVGVDALSAPTKLALNGYFDNINAESVVIQTAASTITSSGDSILTAQDDAASASAEGQTAAGDATAELTNVQTELDLISVANTAIIDLDTDVQAEISTATAGIRTHVDSLLAADCKANLVVVPILVRNSAGFYAAPSQGLIDSLQVFLDARKEVTQTVSVTSGAIFLLPAVITIRVGVKTGFSEAVVATAVSTAIDGILRDREFGADLYESDLEDAVLGVDGVAFTNTSIDGYLDSASNLQTDKNDANGNLIVETSEVITKETITVNTEPFVQA